MLQKTIVNYTQSRDVASVFTNIHQNQYEVQIDNTVYQVKNGVGITLHIGDPVWVHLPSGNMAEMFIMAKT